MSEGREDVEDVHVFNMKSGMVMIALSIFCSTLVGAGWYMLLQIAKTLLISLAED